MGSVQGRGSSVAFMYRVSVHGLSFFEFSSPLKKMKSKNITLPSVSRNGSICRVRCEEGWIVIRSKAYDHRPVRVHITDVVDLLVEDHERELADDRRKADLIHMESQGGVL